MIGDNDIRKSLREVANFLRDRAEESGYGYYAPADPHDFHPDPECCTPEEVERHRLACEAFNRGESLEREPSFTDHPDRAAAAAYVDACMKRGAASASVSEREDGSCVVHCHVGGWGMGSYTIRDEEMLAMAKRLDDMAGEMPPQDDEAP